VAARVGSTIVIVGLMTFLVVGLGAVAYGVHLHGSTLPGLIVTLMLGTAAFTTLGIGITRFISTAETAPVIVNLAVLPLAFISGIFFPPDGMPKVLNDIAKLFPIRALADGLQYAFDPHTAGAGFKGQDLQTLAIWTGIGVALMVSFMRKPQGDAR
jgi:ABC-2 type transport system permease protein